MMKSKTKWGKKSKSEVNQTFIFTLQMNEYEKKAEDLLINSTLKDKTTIQVVAELLEALDKYKQQWIINAKDVEKK